GLRMIHLASHRTAAFSCPGWRSPMPFVMGRLALVPTGEASAPSRPRHRPATRPRRADPHGRRSGGPTTALPVYLATVLGGAVLAVAWLVPGTGVSAVLGWVAALLLVAAVRARRELLPAYCAGLVGHLVGFYWVYRTVCAFGGFGPAAGALI